MADSITAPDPSSAPQESSIVDTLQSLIVAFVLAMTFRGFVTEGFVIPTGSMAPTLMGAHLSLHSKQTGMTFPVGLDVVVPKTLSNARLVDPNLGPRYYGSGPTQAAVTPRMGDRILVLKCLFPFSDPQRYDVVVFKNPTDPTGDSANYIKRLIGLPNEQIWLADGDVFSKRTGEGEFQIRRKPEHVQRAVWQMVFSSDYLPLNVDELNQRTSDGGGVRYEGPPWAPASADVSHWLIKGRRDWVCDTSAHTVLEWSPQIREINDWNAYNMLGGPSLVPVSDVRLSSAIDAKQAGLKTTFQLRTRNTIYEWIIQNDTATMRMRPIEKEEEWTSKSATIRLTSPGKVFNVEFWHVDQAMSMFIDGRKAMDSLEYGWSPLKRLQLATGDVRTEDLKELLARDAQPPQLTWTFEGSPLTLSRVRVDRDLFYRHAMLNIDKNKSYPITGHGFGTNPDEHLQYSADPKDTVLSGLLGPDQFMMCGDNSQMSLDSRLWGNSAEMVRREIDDHPFTVNRKLLIGKAWVVYFPAPFALQDDGGKPVIPDFGRLRFIR